MAGVEAAERDAVDIEQVGLDLVEPLSREQVRQPEAARLRSHPFTTSHLFTCHLFTSHLFTNSHLFMPPGTLPLHLPGSRFASPRQLACESGPVHLGHAYATLTCWRVGRWGTIPTCPPPVQTRRLL